MGYLRFLHCCQKTVMAVGALIMQMNKIVRGSFGPPFGRSIGDGRDQSAPTIRRITRLIR